MSDLNVDEIRDAAGTGAPDFPEGIKLEGYAPDNGVVGYGASSSPSTSSTTFAKIAGGGITVEAGTYEVRLDGALNNQNNSGYVIFRLSSANGASEPADNAGFFGPVSENDMALSANNTFMPFGTICTQITVTQQTTFSPQWRVTAGTARLGATITGSVDIASFSVKRLLT